VRYGLGYVSGLRVVIMPYPMLMSRLYVIVHYSFVVMLITVVLCTVVGSSAMFLLTQKQVIVQYCVDYANYMCYFPWELENGDKLKLNKQFPWKLAHIISIINTVLYNNLFLYKYEHS
jgi:hypothetical protein